MLLLTDRMPSSCARKWRGYGRTTRACYGCRLEQAVGKSINAPRKSDETGGSTTRDAAYHHPVYPKGKPGGECSIQGKAQVSRTARLRLRVGSTPGATVSR